MKIGITFKKDESQLTFILHTLRIRGFEIMETSDEYTYWICDLDTIGLLKDTITLCKIGLNDFKLNMSNIECFLIRN